MCMCQLQQQFFVILKKKTKVTLYLQLNMSRGGHQSNPRLGSTPYNCPVVPGSGNAPLTPRPVSQRPNQSISLQHVLDDVRRVLEEERKLKEEVRRMGHEVVRIGEDCKKIYDLLKSQAESSFTIENSGYKVCSKVKKKITSIQFV